MSDALLIGSSRQSKKESSDPSHEPELLRLRRPVLNNPAERNLGPNRRLH